jgi:uncharacterized membrane protein YhaH (DUF805 family)
MFKDLINAYREFWVKATYFKGVTSLSDWWFVNLANLIITFFTIPIFVKTFGFNAYGIVCIIPQLAIDIRRIKDFGKDWKWIFINLIPIYGSIMWFIWLGFGKTGDSKNKLINLYMNIIGVVLTFLVVFVLAVSMYYYFVNS